MSEHGGVGTFEENAQCRNISAHGGTVEDTFENAQWRKVKHECTLGAWAHLRTHLKMHSGDKSNISVHGGSGPVTYIYVVLRDEQTQTQQNRPK